MLGTDTRLPPFSHAGCRSCHMPKYTITTNNGDGAERSDEPLEFKHTKAATDDAHPSTTRD